MELTTIWFALIAILWIGYFTLEGFDFGVGMLLPVLGKDEQEKRVLYNTIGPLWDGNEVWVLTAGGATFAAFPEWYATLFSGFFLPLLLILVALIIRNLAFDYRGKKDSDSWRANWDKAAIVGSFLPALLWGVAFANIVAGVPMRANPSGFGVLFDGTLFTLLNPFGLLGGLVTLTLFATHGAMFVALKTDGAIRVRARELSVKLGLVAAVLAVIFLVWTLIKSGWELPALVLFALAAVSLLGAIFMATKGREGWAFVGTFLTIALAVAGLFVVLFPAVMPASNDPALSLMAGHNPAVGISAASTTYTLTVMTWVAVIFTPIVLIYQGWTYWVFRKRIATHHIPAVDVPETVSA
ncbi:MAG TPA: cytochrome d ubiquinol oxidase subunit II [Marmoricola sp.]|nr:cytochrome d ubiquinol oxidase subunit II [Marmoricola sp.]